MLLVRFPKTESRPRILERILSISVLELLLTLVCCIMCINDIMRRKRVMEFISWCMHDGHAS